MATTQTTASMTQAERNRINAANTEPNHEQRAHAHARALRALDATAADKRQHVAECESCAYWARSAMLAKEAPLYVMGSPLAVARDAIASGNMSRDDRLAAIASARRIATPGSPSEILLAMHETRLAIEDAERAGVSV